LIGVFKFYQVHLVRAASATAGSNSYEAFRGADAFRMLRAWGLRTSAEVGVVKPQYCDQDSSYTGVEKSIDESLQAMDNVTRAGGAVDYLAMDEPFFAGRVFPQCFPTRADLEKDEFTARKIRHFIRGVRSKYPGALVGLIEPYPALNEQDLVDAIDLVGAWNLAFLHVDVDLAQVRDRQALHADLQALRAETRARNVRLGVILWGGNGSSDRLYFEDALGLTREFRATFGIDPPDLIFQSWAISATGIPMTPSNLPEDRPSHTYFLRYSLSCLLGPGSCEMW
jgi:hypothetical protein